MVFSVLVGSKRENFDPASVRRISARGFLGLCGAESGEFTFTAAKFSTTCVRI
jgi:hypothetical protein